MVVVRDKIVVYANNSSANEECSQQDTDTIVKFRLQVTGINST
jgi:hypothetical protein